MVVSLRRLSARELMAMGTAMVVSLRRLSARGLTVMGTMMVVSLSPATMPLAVPLTQTPLAKSAPTTTPTLARIQPSFALIKAGLAYAITYAFAMLKSAGGNLRIVVVGHITIHWRALGLTTIIVVAVLGDHAITFP